MWPIVRYEMFKDLQLYGIGKRNGCKNPFTVTNGAGLRPILPDLLTIADHILNSIHGSKLVRDICCLRISPVRRSPVIATLSGENLKFLETNLRTGWIRREEGSSWNTTRKASSISNIPATSFRFMAILDTRVRSA